MEGKTPNPRNPECEVDSMFTDRWSPRAFLSDPLPKHQIESLFEAARWAPDLPGLQIFDQNIQNALKFADEREEVILHHLDILRYQTFTECK